MWALTRGDMCHNQFGQIKYDHVNTHLYSGLDFQLPRILTTFQNSAILYKFISSLHIKNTYLYGLFQNRLIC